MRVPRFRRDNRRCPTHQVRIWYVCDALVQVPEAWRKHVLQSTARLAEMEKMKSAQQMIPARQVCTKIMLVLKKDSRNHRLDSLAKLSGSTPPHPRVLATYASMFHPEQPSATLLGKQRRQVVNARMACALHPRSRPSESKGTAHPLIAAPSLSDSRPVILVRLLCGVSSCAFCLPLCVAVASPSNIPYLDSIKCQHAYAGPIQG